MEKFESSPSQQAVIRLLLERGFSVNDQGRVISGDIRILSTGVAHEIEVDRRIVDSTTNAVLDSEELRRILQNTPSIPSPMNLAPAFDLSAFTVEVADANEPGTIATITSKLVDADISICQTMSEDPEFANDPKLCIIADEPIPDDLLNDLSNPGLVRRITTA